MQCDPSRRMYQGVATHKGDDLEKFHLASLVSVGVAFGKWHFRIIAGEESRFTLTWSNSG